MDRRLPVCARSSYWVLGCGVLLVAAALLLSAHATRPDGRSSAELRLAVQVAVADQEGCLTCHVASARPPLRRSDLALAVQHDAILLPGEDNAPPDPVPTVVNERLRDAGQRLLDLPAAETNLFRTAATDYLRAYRAARDDASTATSFATMGLLDSLEGLLRDLEHQASPVRISANRAVPHSAAAAVTAPLVATALAGVAAASVVWRTHFVTHLDLAGLLCLPALSVVLVKRRGPPVSRQTTEFCVERKIAAACRPLRSSFFVASVRSPSVCGRPATGC